MTSVIKSPKIMSSINIASEYQDSNFAAGETNKVEDVIESGRVLVFPNMRFALTNRETRFLGNEWTDVKAKNISLQPSKSGVILKGAQGDEADIADLQIMIARFADNAEALVKRLFPHYIGQLRRGNTSFRPAEIKGRKTSWRKDDTKLHVDAFPSNPTQGVRLLRVFTNVNPEGQSRKWRVGESFEDFAKKYLAKIGRPLPLSAKLLRLLRITKKERTEYDHVMLKLHDLAKADANYQQTAPQQHLDFMPGTTWVVYSDQVLHAAMEGKFMFEQTFYLDSKHQLDQSKSPLKTLERLTERKLVS